MPATVSNDTDIDEAADWSGDEAAEGEGAASSLVNSVSEMVERIDFEDALDSAGRWVRDHPVLALGAAAGVGFLLGTLVRSGSSGETHTGGLLRQTAADVGRELESQALGFRRSAAEKIAAVASGVMDRDGAEDSGSGRSQALNSVADTLKTAITAIALNKLGAWLKRSD